MRQKKSIIPMAVVVVLGASICLVFALQNSSEHKVLFEKAKFTMETKGDLKSAIKLFEEIILKYSNEREYAAKSQLYVGLCYEKLGQEQANQAQQAFQKVVENYPEQKDVVGLAKEKLSILLKAQAVVKKGDKDLKIRKIWAGPGADMSGTPSPDGRYLSFVDWQNTDGDLAVHDLVTNENHRLTNNASQSMEWANHSIFSPDGQRVTYSWYNEDGLYDLRIVNLDGSQSRVLYCGKDGWNTEPRDWSLDGGYILAWYYQGWPPRASQIVTVSITEGSLKLIKTLDRDVPIKMSFSPDGRYVVYDYPPEEKNANHDIFLLAVDGGHEAPLVEHPASDYVLGWTPDGKNVLFASDRMGSWGAWLIPVLDGKPAEEPKLVKQDTGKIEPMGFTRDGSFFYGIGGWVSDIYAAKVDLATGKVLGAPELMIQRFIGSNYGPEWSPDGEYLAYISRRTPASSSAVAHILCIRSLKTSQEHELFPELNWFNVPRWSPDGSALMVQSFDRSNRLGEYRIDVKTGDVSTILQVERDRYHETIPPCWSRDGKSIFYVRNNMSEQHSEIMLRDLETGRDKDIARIEGKNSYFIGLALSKDGRKLAARMWNEEQHSVSLVVLPAEGGEIRELLKLQEPEGFREFAWTPDARQLLFIKSTGGPDSRQSRELFRISCEGGEPQKLELSIKGMSQFGIHPDGRQIALTATEYKTEIWVMENFLPEEKSQEKSR